ncbi:MAG: ASCH domain-containing protein [Bacteroidota bacterium]|nr:ASCH domain-containing protein [Bacteroidota bacterium]
MKALSVKQPWAWLICYGIKDIENRTWKPPEKMKGKRVLIHASAKPAGHLRDVLNQEQRDALSADICINGHDDNCKPSAIIGSVEIVDCVINNESIWADKTNLHEFENSLTGENGCIPIYNWVLDNPVLFDKPILNIKGKLNFWESKYEQIECPLCNTMQLHDNSDIGVPGWGNPVHTCEKCGYAILESEL